MPRTARIAAPHLPHHLCQRGHNQRPIFHGTRDYESFLETLAEFREALRLRVYGYCLMTNHVHLLVDPGSDAGNLGRLMKRLAGRHTRRINGLRKSSGTIWGGRYKCSPIETERYLMTCLRYVDLNPVRARMVARAEDYPWSSYRAHAGLIDCPWLDVDPLSAEIQDVGTRHVRYRQFVAEGENELELNFIRESLQLGHVTAQEAFARRLARKAGLVLPERRPGRPLHKKTGA